MYFKKNISYRVNYKIELDKDISIENHKINIVEESDTDGNDICRLNSNNIKPPLYIRNKKEGDYISLKGTNGRKKIKDIFIEAKLPKQKRDYYPILVDSNDNILWIPNIKKSKFNTKKGEKCDIILKYCEMRKENKNE